MEIIRFNFDKRKDDIINEEIYLCQEEQYFDSSLMCIVTITEEVK